MTTRNRIEMICEVLLAARYINSNSPIPITRFKRTANIGGSQSFVVDKMIGIGLFSTVEKRNKTKITGISIKGLELLKKIDELLKTPEIIVLCGKD